MKYGFTCNGKLLTTDYSNILGISDPYNPLNLPPYTFRVKYKPGTIPWPGITSAISTLVDADNNIWDITCERQSLIGLFTAQDDLLEVLGANTTGVTNMYCMFQLCKSLTTVQLFDTSSVTNMNVMFSECSSLTTVPLLYTASVTDMSYMFYGCIYVESGALAFYQQASTQTTPPQYHEGTFKYCGIYTQTGSAELAQIPSDWK